VRTLLLLPVAVLFSLPAFAGKSPRVELGRRLFMDPTVSRAARFSCASCHSPEHGFSDPRVLSEDENGATARHSQPLLDLKDGVGMHWDGEFFTVRELLVARLAPTAEAQAQALALASRHFAAARGHGGGDEGAFGERLRQIRPPSWIASGAPTVTLAAPLVRRLDEEGRYAAGFRAAFGSSRVTTERLVEAMEAYVLSLGSGTSAYDRDDLSPSARRGQELFQGKANCVSCHTGDRFTDDRFHNTGVAFVPDLPGHPLDTGRANRSFVAEDSGRFKTPSLRDIARRAPYMHDGSSPTLLDVVAYYDRGGTPNPGLDANVRPLGLDPREIADLVAFLESLTSDERPGLGPAPARPRETRVRIEDLEGRPIEGLAVEIKPFGDRLGKEGVAGAVRATTGKGGWLSFPFPASTHVTLSAHGLAIGEGQPLPDYVREAKLIAAPWSATAVRVMGRNLPDALVGQGNRGEITLRKVRRLSAGEALYVADRPPQGSGVIVFGNLPGGLVSRQYWIDTRTGFAQAIDLRPDPDAPAPPTRAPGTLPPRQDKVPGEPADERLAPPRLPDLGPHDMGTRRGSP
jgi:cytochrome c peroxidase